MKKRIMSGLLVLVMSFAMVFAMCACKQGESGAVMMNAKSVFVPLGKELSLSVSDTENADDAENLPLQTKWSSSRKKVATVDENGLVTAVGMGRTTIVAKTQRGTAKCEVEVFDDTLLEALVVEDARVNISNHQNKMKINMKKALGTLFHKNEQVVAVTDGDGRAMPVSYENYFAEVQWTGDVGLHTWKFYTTKKVFTMDVCHATHIIGVFSEFAALSDDWNKATMGNGHTLFDDWKYVNDTKDWYVVLDNDIDCGMNKDYINYYSFGRRDAKDGGYAVFQGTFDGRGYQLKRLRTERGFITILGQYGVIKNLAITDSRCGEIGGGGVLGWVGFGKVQNVFIDAWLYFESQHQSGMYWYTDKETPLTVENCLVMMELKQGATSWPSGDYHNPGFFSTNGVDNGNAETTIVNSYGISSYFTRVDGNRDGTEGIAFKNYEAFVENANLSSFDAKLWQFSSKNLFFGNSLVFEVKE